MIKTKITRKSDPQVKVLWKDLPMWALLIPRIDSWLTYFKMGFDWAMGIEGSRYPHPDLTGFLAGDRNLASDYTIVPITEKNIKFEIIETRMPVCACTFDLGTMLIMNTALYCVLPNNKLLLFGTFDDTNIGDLRLVTPMAIDHGNFYSHRCIPVNLIIEAEIP